MWCFTIPALIFLMPDSALAISTTCRSLMLSLAGGILGVLMMVPLRRALIVKEHGILPYPEGTACAEVLVAGERGGKLATLVFSGLGIGASGRRCRGSSTSSVHEIGYVMPRTSQFPNATLDVDISPEYLGVGYVIGPRIAGTMVAGGVLAWLGLLPLLSILGRGYHRAIPADPSELRQQSGHRAAVPAIGDGSRSTVERVHPLHRRRRRARGGIDYARAYASDDRLVGRGRPSRFSAAAAAGTRHQDRA